MHKIRKFTIILVSLATLITILVPLNKVEASSINQTQKQNITISEYLNNTSSFKKVTSDEVDAFFDKKDNADRYVYVGRPTCYYCRQYSLVLKEFNNLVGGNLYYLNIDESKDNEAYAFENLQIPGTPTVMRIKNGEIANAWVGGGKNANELYTFLKNNG